jgi:hypothetical protein
MDLLEWLLHTRTGTKEAKKANETVSERASFDSGATLVVGRATPQAFSSASNPTELSEPDTNTDTAIIYCSFGFQLEKKGNSAIAHTHGQSETLEHEQK